MKLEIHQFDPIIYPFKLWVISSKDIKTINELFTTLEDNEVCFDIPANTNAWVSHIPLRHNNLNGVLMVFENKKAMTACNITHETTHATKVIWDYLGEEERGEEANAYLSGWIAECVEKVKLNKE